MFHDINILSQSCLIGFTTVDTNLIRSAHEKADFARNKLSCFNIVISYCYFREETLHYYVVTLGGLGTMYFSNNVLRFIRSLKIMTRKWLGG